MTMHFPLSSALGITVIELLRRHHQSTATKKVYLSQEKQFPMGPSQVQSQLLQWIHDQSF